MFSRPVAWLAVLQLFAILLGHAGSVLGEAWCRKFRAVQDYPSLTIFYAHSGLWLLLIPLVWFSAFMIQQHSVRQPPQIALWVATGTVLLVVFIVTGALALLITLSYVGY